MEQPTNEKDAMYEKYIAYRKKYLNLQVGGSKKLSVTCVILVINDKKTKEIESCEYPTSNIEYVGNKWSDVVDVVIEKFRAKYKIPTNLTIDKIVVRSTDTKEIIKDVDTPVKYFDITKLKIYCSI